MKVTMKEMCEAIEKAKILTKPDGTFWVCVRPDGIISDCAALWKKFKGQPFTNLIKWLRDAEVAEISKE